MDEDNRRALKKTLADLELLSRTARGPLGDDRRRPRRRRPCDAQHGAPHRAAAATGPARRAQRGRLRPHDGAVAGAGTTASGTLESTRTDLQRFTGETLPEVRELVAELRELTASLQRVPTRWSAIRTCCSSAGRCRSRGRGNDAPKPPHDSRSRLPMTTIPSLHDANRHCPAAAGRDRWHESR